MTEIYFGESGITYGDGHWYGEDDTSPNGKLWQFKFHVALPSYHSHHSSHKGDHDKVPGGEGTFLRSNKLTARHMSGDTSGAYGPLMNADGSATFRRDKHDVSFQNAINADSSLVHAPIAGMRVNTDASLGGLTAGAWTLSNAKYSAGTGFELSCDVKFSSASGIIAIGIGNPGSLSSDKAFYLVINNGACALFRVNAGTPTSMNGLPNNLVNLPMTILTSTYYRMRLAVDFAQQLVEAVIEDPEYLPGNGVAYLMLPTSPTWPSFPTTGVNIALYDSTGSATFSNLQVSGRRLYLSDSLPYQNTVQPNALTVGLDNVPDGASRFAVKSVGGTGYPNVITGGGPSAGTQIGPTGPTICEGSGAPSGTPAGGAGSIYINTSSSATNHLYWYNGSSWVSIA